MTGKAQNPVPYLFLSIFLILCACQNRQESKSGSEPSMSIAKARSMALNTEVTIQGTVTVASGTFASSNPYGYAIQDAYGGIYVMDSTANARNKYQKGQPVEVTGTITEVYGIRMIRETSSGKNGTPLNHTPLVLGTGAIGPENTGMLVTSSGRPDSLINDMPYGYKLYINDGSGALEVFINTTTGLLQDSSLWMTAETVTVTGFSSQFESTFELCPRNKEDIQLTTANRQ